MTDKKLKVQVVPLLDDIAAEAVASSEFELREQLLDAGLDPDAEIEEFFEKLSAGAASFKVPEPA